MEPVEQMTFADFCAHYRMDHRTARDWIKSGTAPGHLIPGKSRYHIPIEWVLAFDRGEHGRWVPQDTAPEPPIKLVQFRRSHLPRTG